MLGDLSKEVSAGAAGAGGPDGRRDSGQHDSESAAIVRLPGCPGRLRRDGAQMGAPGPGRIPAHDRAGQRRVR